MKPERWRIDIFGLGAGEDSWESLGEQGGQTSKSEKKSTLNIHWKEWCWSWSSNTLATWCEKPTHWKRRWYWERLKANGEGGAEDEMVTCITDSVDTNLSKFRAIMKDREDCSAAVLGVPKSWTQLSDKNNKISDEHIFTTVISHWWTNPSSLCNDLLCLLLQFFILI